MAAPGIIDAHHHLWDFGRYRYDWITPEMTPLRRNFLPADLKAVMDEAGVSATVLVQTFHSAEETAWFLDMADAHAFIAGVVGWTDLTDPQIDTALERLSPRGKLAGFRHVVQGEPDDDWLLRPEVLRGLRALARRGYTYDVLIFPRHLRHVPEVARQVPDLKMVIDHVAKPPIKAGPATAVAAWRRDLAAAAAHPNVFCKLSGLVTEADWQRWTPADLKPYVDHALECFGFERLMFGSDWPVCLLAGSYQQVLDALRETLGAISAAEADRLYRKTAVAFYGLNTGE